MALLVGIGVLIANHLQPAKGSSGSVVVRVIDDGAKDGPAVLTTAVVPLR